MSLRTLSTSAMRWRARVAALRRSEAGATVVEFALVAPILLLIVFAAVDFGRALWIQNVLVAGLREGARDAALGSHSTLADSTLATNTGRMKAAQYISGVLGRTVTAGEIKMTYCGTVGATAPCNATAALGLIYFRLNLTGGTMDYYPFTPGTPFISRLGLSTIYVKPAAFRWELSG